MWFKKAKHATFTHPRTGEKMAVLVHGVRERDKFLLCGFIAEGKAPTFSTTPDNVCYLK